MGPEQPAERPDSAHRIGWRQRSSRVCWIPVLTMVIAGCTQVSHPEQASLVEQMDVDDFMHEHLPKQAMVTVAEAYRSMLILADGDDKFSGFEARETSVVQRGFVRPEWKLTRDRCIDRGTVAYMVRRILQVRGGVDLALFGDAMKLGDRRYATRELVSMDIMKPGPDYRYMTGAELLELMGKADEYMADKGLYQEEKTDLRQVLETGSTQSRPAPTEK